MIKRFCDKCGSEIQGDRCWHRRKTMIKRFCDKCGVEIVDNRWWHASAMLTLKSEKWKNSSDALYVMDTVCKACVEGMFRHEPLAILRHNPTDL